jgi:hypothetical protein
MVANGHIGCTSHKLGSFQSIFVPGKFQDYSTSSARLTGTDVLKWPFCNEATSSYGEHLIHNFMSHEPYELELSLLWRQPPIMVQLHEYQPKAQGDTRTVMYILDKAQDRYVRQMKYAVPLALAKEEWYTDDVTLYEKYLDDIIKDRTRLRRFGRTCYSGFNDDFLQRLFEIFMDYNPGDEKEVCFLPFSMSCNTDHSAGCSSS